ncbi:MAG: serine/threonine protein kinase, partial [Halobacteriales archaeon]|nr:serine/threonine protein kinase [Halobacteriales archaeon]
AVVGMCWAVALFLTFVGPADRPRRLLALFLALQGFDDLFNLKRVVTSIPPLVFDDYSGDLQFLTALAGIAFLACYPRPVRWRSGHGAVLALAALLAVVGLAAWTFDRGLMVQPWPSATGPFRRTLLDRVTYFELPTAVHALLAVSAVARARDTGTSSQRGTGALVAGMYAATFWIGFGGVGTDALASIGAGPYFLSSAFSTGVIGDCCGLAKLTFLAAIVVPVLAAAYLAARRWTFAPLAIGLLGIPGGYALATRQIDFFSIFLAFSALGTLYALQRHGVLGGASAPRWLLLSLALGALVTVFLTVAIVAVLDFPDSPLGLAFGTFAGLLFGGVAALVVLPESPLSLMGQASPAGPNRIGAYRTALEKELADGRSPGEARDRLKPLRRELGVSETEHAVMDHMLADRGARPIADALRTTDLFLGRYRVERKLGEGGNGATYLCRDERVERRVVLKLLRAAGRDAQGLDELVREARAIGSLQHPNVVTLLDVEQVGDEAFIVMEHMAGGSLEQRLEAGALGPGEFRRVALDLLAALEAVHAAGLVHRDVKPSNVLLAADGRAKLADFGVAHLAGFDTTAGAGGAGPVGTIRYMSPEQAGGKRATPQSDLFSAGATLFEACTGEAYLAPLPGESAVELQLRAAFAKPFRRAVRPPALRGWFAKTLAPSPRKRFPSAAAMRAALERALPVTPGRTTGASARRR